MQIEDYISGTVSIANGSTALSGSGTAWKTAALKAGDIFYKSGYAILIASVEDEDAITLADAWPGTTLSDAAYAIRFAPDNSRVQGTTRQLLDQWRQGIYVTPDAIGTLAGRDDYDDQPEGFKYLADDSDPWVLYAKLSNTSGDWSTGTSWGGPQGDRGLPGSSDVVGTSASSVAIGTGAKTFAIVEADRGWGVGARLRGSSDADAANFVEGPVTSYADNSLTLDVDLTGGSGTHADWTINLAGQPGAESLDIAANTHAATSKTTPVDADELPVTDSAASFVLKKLTWANVKATLKAYFDTLYTSTTLARREVLTGARTYYVSTTGSDANDGLTGGTAFATIQKAINVVATLDIGANNVTIQLADGTYSENLTLKSFVGAGRAIINGNQTTPANVVLSAGASAGITGSNVVGVWDLRYVKITGSSASLALTNIVFCYRGLVFAGTGNHFYCLTGALVTCEGNYEIAASPGRHIWLANKAYLQCVSKTITLTGSPAFAACFIECDSLSAALINGNIYSGSATGARYIISTNAVIATGGAGTSYFPGDSAGSVVTGGQYA